MSVARIPRGHSYEYCLRVVVYNTNLTIRQEIRQTWGGHLGSAVSRHPGWKPGYALIWTNAAAARLISRVGPHMRVKATQVQAMAQFQNYVLRTRRRRDRLGRLLPLSSRQRKIREGFYQFLKQLNRRGPKAVPERPRFHTRTQEAPIVSTEYLAGFIDAEGSLMLSKAKKVIRWNPAYSVKVYVDNTNKAILEEIQRSYQGTITTQPARKAAWKPGYKLVWTGRRAERLLSLVEPHLHVKRSHAKTLSSSSITRRGRSSGVMGAASRDCRPRY